MLSYNGICAKCNSWRKKKSQTYSNACDLLHSFRFQHRDCTQCWWLWAFIFLSSVPLCENWILFYFIFLTAWQKATCQFYGNNTARYHQKYEGDFNRLACRGSHGSFIYYSLFIVCIANVSDWVRKYGVCS